MHWPLLHPRSRRTPPSATPSPTPTRRSSRQVLASAPAGNTAATRSRLLSPTHTQNTLHTARPAPPVTLGRLSWTKPPARAHLLRPPRQPCLPAPPPGGQTHGYPPTLELYSPLAPHNATPLPRTRATPTACHSRHIASRAFTAAHPLPPPSEHATRGPDPHCNAIVRTPFGTPARPHSPPLPAWVRSPGLSQPRHPQRTQARPYCAPSTVETAAQPAERGTVACVDSRRALDS